MFITAIKCNWVNINVEDDLCTKLSLINISVVPGDPGLTLTHPKNIGTDTNL